VTVAGLLSGNDIIETVLRANLPSGTKILVPDVALRTDSEILIDDISLEDIAFRTGLEVFPVPSDARGFWEWVESDEPLKSRGGKENLRAVAS
jgi:NifB/MoaA-like Fe-S oxidoreductase